MKLYIKAQASPKSVVEDSLDNHTVVILEHLAYLFIFGEIQDKNKWRRDIRKNLHSMPKVRIGRKVRYLNPQEILDATFNQHCSDTKLKAILESAPEDKPEYTADYTKVHDLDAYKLICQQYFKWLAVELSKDGYINASDCYQKLDELGL